MKKAFLILSLMMVIILSCNDNGGPDEDVEPGDTTVIIQPVDTVVVDTIP